MNHRRGINFVLAIGLAGLLACQDGGQAVWQGECVDSHEIQKVVMRPVMSNVLRYEASIKTKKELDVYLKYWEDTGTSFNQIADEKFLYSRLSSGKNQHQIVLTNLKQNSSYKAVVVAQNTNCKTYSQEVAFTTGQIPVWYPFKHPQSDSILSSGRFDGLVHTHTRDIPGYLLLLNHEMEPVWYHEVPRSIKVAHWTKHNTFLTILSVDTTKFSSGKEIAEFDIDGNMVFRITTGQKGLDKVVHHEVRYDNNGNIMTLTFEIREFDLTHLGGTEKDKILGEGILILNKQGEKVWEWSVFDQVDPTTYPNIMNIRDDWLHANSLFQDQEGNYLVSFRNINQIWKIDGQTGKVVWKLGGEDGDFGLADSLKFYGQHAAHVNHRGELMILDNGRNDSIPKVKSFLINEEKMTATAKINFAMPGEFYSASKGSAYLVEDKYVMYCASDKHRAYFFDLNGEYQGLLQMTYKSYRTAYIDQLFPIGYVK